MAELEKDLYEDWPTKPLTWLRYIDDILVIWPGSPQSLEEFVAYLNSKHPTIKFTHETSEWSVDFLDLTIYKGKRFSTTGKFDIKPFFKKTNKFQYLQYSSSHPRTVFRSILKGELTRLLRACSDQEVYGQIKSKMSRIFKDRGYPKRLIYHTIQEVPFSNRAQVLHPTKPPSPFDTYLVLDYTPDLDVSNIRRIIRPQLIEDKVPNPCLSLKKTRSLGQILVRARLKDTNRPIISMDKITIPWTPILEGRSAKCGTPGCKCCGVMSHSNLVFSSYNYKSFPTAKHSNCSSSSVIYLIECKKCNRGNQYVGQTHRFLSQRIAGHRAASKRKTNLPIYKHFLSPGHTFEKDIKVSVLEKTSPSQLLAREAFWIRSLDTKYPRGLNSRFDCVHN